MVIILCMWKNIFKMFFSLFVVFHQFQHIFGHILAVGSPNQLSWITKQCLPIPPQATDYQMTSELAVTNKWPLHSMYEINCHIEIVPCQRPLGNKSDALPIELNGQTFLKWNTSSLLHAITLHLKHLNDLFKEK